MTTSASGAAAAASPDEVLLFGSVVANAPVSNATPALIAAMLDSGAGISDLVRAGTISQATAYLYATNAGNLRVQLADVPDEDSLITR